MATEALSKSELSALVEGWTPRILQITGDGLEVAGSGVAGAVSAKTGTAVPIAIGSIGTIIKGILGPTHPYWGLALSPFKGMVSGGVAVKAFLFVKVNEAKVNDAAGE